MLRFLLVVLLSLPPLLAACGGDDDGRSSPKPRPGVPGAGASATEERSGAEAPSDAARSDSLQQNGIYERKGSRPLASERVERAAVALARYCLEKIGHKTGLRETPPTKDMAVAKDQAVRTLVAVISQRPGLRLKGKENIQDRVTQAILVLKRDDCDKRAAKRLERALATYPEP